MPRPLRIGESTLGCRGVLRIGAIVQAEVTQQGTMHMRDRPAGRARHEAETTLQIEIVDLVDHAVDIVGQRRALLLDQLPVVEQGRGGRIINVSGLAARSTGTIIGSVRNVSVAALTKNIADELIYNEKGNQVLLVKYLPVPDHP